MAHQCMKVVQAANSAKENGGKLDLSDCQLMQMPDAVYHLMRDTPLNSCSLANNVISKIPPKLPLSFSLITELDLSGNRISGLPSEMTVCTALEFVDISSNSLVSLPPVLFQLSSIHNIKAGKNFIADVDVEAVMSCETLESLGLEENPLSPASHENLNQIDSIRITVSPRQREEWEDLSI